MNKKRVLAIVAIIAIVALMAVCLCACNAESIAKKLEKKGYDVEVATDKDIADTEEVRKAIGFEGEIKWAVFGAGSTDVVIVIKFAKTADAKDVQAKLEKATDEIPGVKSVCKRVGSVIFCGTEQGVKDAM